MATFHEEEYINLFTLDYRLNGFSVKYVFKRIDEKITRFNEFFLSASLSKGDFFNFLKLFKREKDFARYAKGANEKELYGPYIKMFLAELKENLRKRARIFETEEEDRTNKKHRKCILNMLPFFRDFSLFLTYFFCKFEKNTEFQNEIFGVERSYMYTYFSQKIKSGVPITDGVCGWRNQKRK